MKGLSINQLLGRGLNIFEEKNAPKHLYVEGPMKIPLGLPRVSVVGTRKPTRSGIEETSKLVKMLIDNGATIVSGLAAGIDTEAHRSAMKYGGRTVAVLGTPLDRQYPASNRHLQGEIASRHLLVSQFPVGQPVRRGNFVTRNKTMALISNATAIVEAGDGSGTIHQGWEALRLGRPLFVCRTAAKARPEWLKDMERYGAIILQDYNDILYEIPADIKMVNVFASTP